MKHFKNKYRVENQNKKPKFYKHKKPMKIKKRKIKLKKKKELRGLHAFSAGYPCWSDLRKHELRNQITIIIYRI